MKAFRAYIKSRTNLKGKPLSNAGMKVQSFSLRRDLLTKSTSDITLLQIPDGTQLGDVLCLYDETGRTWYNGVITSIGDSIQCDQMLALFDDNWLYKIPNQENLEKTIEKILKDDFIVTSDIILLKTFYGFDIETISNTLAKLPTQEPNTVINFEEFLYDIYQTYGVGIDFNIPFNEETPTMIIGKPSYKEILLSNNAISIMNIAPTVSTEETNKLVIYSSEGSYRNTYYSTESGITNDSSALDRLQVVKTSIQFTDDEEQTVVQANLPNHLYNHQIEVVLLLDSSLYDFNDFHLGQPFKIFYKNRYYQSVLTGYEIEADENGFSYAKLIFGKVRVRLEDKLYRLFQKK